MFAVVGGIKGGADKTIMATNLAAAGKGLPECVRSGPDSLDHHPYHGSVRPIPALYDFHLEQGLMALADLRPEPSHRP